MKSEKLLDILANSKGYNIALFTTFNFDVDFFERTVLYRLLNNSIRRISVFVDSQELEKALSSISYTLLGCRYAINPVTLHGSFHPKIILLLGENKARLIVGSMNLTVSGYCINNEVFNCIDYDADHLENRKIIYDAMLFFADLHRDDKHTYQLDTHLLQSLESFPYFRPAPENETVFLIQNMKESILQQVFTLITEPVREVYVAVPYYDNDLSAFQALKDKCKEAEVHLYLQQHKSTFPEDVYNTRAYYDDVNVFSKTQIASKDNAHFYHGKVFMFRTDNESYVLYGSGNCTQSALLHTIKDGNVECDLLVKGSRNQFDSFFESFQEADTHEIDSHIMSYESSVSGNYYFLYGRIKDSSIELNIGYKRHINDAEFFLGDIPLEWYEDKRKVVVIVEENDDVDTVFDIQIKYSGVCDTVRCWFNDNKSLELFRVDPQEKISLEDREDFATGDKLKDYYEKYLQAELTCVEDLDEWEYVHSSILKQTDGIENDDAEPADGDDYLVQIDITDCEYSQYRQYRIIEKIRGRIKSRYTKSLAISNYYRSGRDVLTEKVELKDETKKRRKATTEEKRFEQFVKRKIRSIQDDRFLEQVQYDHFFGLIAVVFEIIQNIRTGIELVEDIFIDQYVIPTRIELLMHLIKKYDNSEDKEELIRFVLNTLLDNHVRIEGLSTEEDRTKYEMLNRKLLLMVEDTFSIRSCYDQYLVSLDDGVFTQEAQERFNGAKKYINGLYGYRNIEQLLSYLKYRFGDESDLEITKSNAKIIIYSDNPEKFIRPDDNVVAEIFKYSINVQRLKVMQFIIYSKGENLIERIEHKISFEYHKLITVIYWKNGIKDTRKPKYYSF